MEAKDIVLDALDRIQGSLHRTLDGLTLEEIHQQPKRDSNSIAWLVWHLTRVQDTSVSGLMGQDHLWISQGWHTKFELDPEASNDGFGHTPEHVSAFRVASIETLLDYHDHVVERSKTYVAGLAAARLCHCQLPVTGVERKKNDTGVKCRADVKHRIVAQRPADDVGNPDTDRRGSRVDRPGPGNQPDVVPRDPHQSLREKLPHQESHREQNEDRERGLDRDRERDDRIPHLVIGDTGDHG